MIDQNLIAGTTKHAVASINTATIVSDNFLKLDNFLSAEAIYKLQQYINNVSESEWNAVPLQETLPRKSINWAPDTIIEELHIVADNLTELVNQTFGTSNKQLQAVQLWRDAEGYLIPPHKDNPVIDISIQIYLFDCPQECGTSFKINDNHVEVPFVHNTGYMIYKKSYEERCLHWSTAEVPDNVVRYSLYLTWSVYGKQAPDPHDIAHLI